MIRDPIFSTRDLAFAQASLSKELFAERTGVGEPADSLLEIDILIDSSLLSSCLKISIKLLLDASTLFSSKLISSFLSTLAVFFCRSRPCRNSYLEDPHSFSSIGISGDFSVGVDGPGRDEVEDVGVPVVDDDPGISRASRDGPSLPSCSSCSGFLSIPMSSAGLLDSISRFLDSTDFAQARLSASAWL